MIENAELVSLKRNIPLWKIVAARIPKYERRNGEWIFTCPFHKDGKERTPSFTVFKNKEGIWLYKCFGCQNKGSNVFDFVQKFDKLSFQDAVQKVKTEGEWVEGQNEVDQTFSTVCDPDEAATSFPLDRLQQAQDALDKSSVAARWLADRGITLETAHRFNLGFVQSIAAINEHHPLVDQGWLLIPTLDPEDPSKITLLKYRTMVPGADNSDRWARKKGMKTTVYNLQTVTPFDDVYIVEGPFDVMVLEQAGFRAVALDSASHSPSPEDRDVITRANNIFLAGDSDTPGQQAMEKLYKELRDRVYKIQWPAIPSCSKVDANEVLKKVCGNDTEKFRETVEKLTSKALEQPVPFFHNIIHTVDTMETIKPLDDTRRLRFPWKMDAWVPVLPGDVMVVSASDSKTGKSTWLMNILFHNAMKYDQVVVNYSAEMQPDQYARRVVAHLTMRDRNNLEKEDFKRAMQKLIAAQTRFYTGYKPGSSYIDVIESLKWAKRRLGASILVIDPLPFLIRGMKDQWQAESHAMRLMKDLAFDFQLIMISVDQPRKRKKGQTDTEMTPDDIGGSYTKNTDASQVFLLHRDRIDTAADGEPIFSNTTKVTLALTRDSRTFWTYLWFNGETATFTEMPEEQEEPSF